MKDAFQAHVPIRICNPSTSHIIAVNAVVSRDRVENTLAYLGPDVVKSLRLKVSRREDTRLTPDLGFDVPWHALPLITNEFTVVGIWFREHYVEGEAAIEVGSEGVELGRKFMRALPRGVDLARYKSGILRAPKVFLSYSHQDRPFARALARALTARGIHVWLDQGEISIGESLVARTSSAIDDVDFVVAVISPHSLRSAWVQRELAMAMTHEISNKKVVVLPVLKGDCEAPQFLRDKLCADCRSPHSRRRAIQQLVDSINRL